MANFTENPIWEEVYQLATTDPVQGGPGGKSNEPLQDLVNRTAFLKALTDAFSLADAKEYSADMDDMKTQGLYLVRAGATNKPISTSGLAMVISKASNPDLGNTQSVVQMFVAMFGGPPVVYFRLFVSGVWYTWQNLVYQSQFDTEKARFVGMVASFAMQTPPSGWLKCDGSAVSRSTYSALFTAIGTTYGSGNGSTTFNLPDMRGEFVRGFDDGRGIDAGRIFGSAQADEFKSHTHTEQVQETGLSDSATGGTRPRITSTLTQSTGATGGSETRPRNIALMYCIRY